jgi:hypothetical protein
VDQTALDAGEAYSTGVAGRVFKIACLRKSVWPRMSPNVPNRFRHFDPNGTEFLVKPGRGSHSPKI